MTNTASLNWNPEVLDRKERINRQAAAVTTAAVFSLLLLSLWFLGMYRQNPEPETIGTIIIFGTSAEGSGEDATEPNTSADVQSQQNNSTPSAQTNTPAVTQNMVEAPAVNSSLTNTTAPTTINEQPSVVQGSQFSGFNSNANSTSGQGNNNVPSVAGDIRGTGTNLTGGLTNGEQLDGRSAVHRERPATQKDVYGNVRVKITVNSQGKVISALYSSDGSTTADSYLKQISIEAALKWEWTADPQHRPEQIGFIDFKYTAQ